MNIVSPENYSLPRELSVSFTGHREAKLPWGRNERDPRCAAFKARLENAILRAYSEGTDYFLSGMADGVDLYAAEAVLKLRRRCRGMELVCVFPFGFGAGARIRRCAQEAHTVVSLADKYTPGCFQSRNGFLVRHAAKLICGFSGDLASGTGATIRLALNEGVDAVIINI
ncbi:MAG: DUF1273 family protein [Clostridia bacterium]|jgi:uncharacterized phage-like protein YoqJ|nr:DUF1273 family protein [Clostridia bacterium]MBR4659379.1 DUF1273 family protein [Clostridia bacterium]MBR6108762.1 DUF1273 family protein [Clostridia bacterium]